MQLETRNEWCADLRSGNIPQTLSTLKNNEGPNNSEGYCCLGVLIRNTKDWLNKFPEFEVVENAHSITIKTTEPPIYGSDDPHVTTDSGEIPPRVLKELGLSEQHASFLMDMNDTDRRSFADIADWIEANVPID